MTKASSRSSRKGHHGNAGRLGVRQALKCAQQALGPLERLRDELALLYGWSHPRGSTEGVLVTESNTAYRIVERLRKMLEQERARS